MQDLEPGSEILPVERALGVRWNVNTDEFVFKMQLRGRPPTRRGLLSVVSSDYDPLGFFLSLPIIRLDNPLISLPEKVEVGRCYPERLSTSNSAVARVVTSYGTIFSPSILQT